MENLSPWLALGGAGLGLLKGYTLDRDKENRQRALAAATARYSPWTGMQPGPVQEADPWGNALQGATSGFGLGQNINAANQQQNFQDEYLKLLRGQQGGQQGR